MPGLAPMAWSLRLIAWVLTAPPSLGLPEAVGDELANLPDAVPRARPHRRDGQHLPLGRCEHQDSHDGLAVDLLGVGLEGDVALAAVRELNQLGCCPGVQAQLVDDGELGFRALRRHHSPQASYTQVTARPRGTPRAAPPWQ